MKCILTYNEFLEGKFFDDARIKIIGDNKLGKIITDIQNKKFNIDCEFISNITISNEDNIYDFKLKWNHNEEHSLIDRLDKRTSFKSISEFNEYLITKLDLLLKNNLIDINNGNYLLYDNDINISLIINFNIRKKILKIVTIVNGFSDKDVKGIFYI